MQFQKTPAITIPQPTLTDAEERTICRQSTAERLERLAALIRRSEGATVAQLDEAYSVIVKMAAQVKEIIQ